MEPKVSTVSTPSGATLRRPVQIVKKRSGPLESALDELNRIESPASDTAVSTAISSASPRTEDGRRLSIVSPSPPRRRGTIKDKKRERWLLTRKTWKYMTDAGRKLIPENAQNRKDDIPKIEAHFQHVCAMEPRYIPWRRKSSYPGAMRNSKRRLKQLLTHTGQKQPLALEAQEQEEHRNADHIIEILQSYLRLDESMKTTTLLGTKTVRPDQTASPSAKRPNKTRTKAGLQFTGTQNIYTIGQTSRIDQLSEIDQLLERLKKLSNSATLPNMCIPPENITLSLLENKALLKQIYNSLKKQQLHRILSKHSNMFPSKHARATLKHSSSLSSLFSGIGNRERHNEPNIDQLDSTKKSIMNSPGNLDVPSDNLAQAICSTSGNTNSTTTMTLTLAKRKTPPATLDIPTISSRSLKLSMDSTSKTSPSSSANPPDNHQVTITNATRTPTKPVRKFISTPPQPEKQYNSCGTQTNFIQLNEIKRLAEDYKQHQREEADAKSPSTTTPGATDDEAEKSNVASSSGYHHRRKSSIDNEDISQSVSDTIKRYLRMARKKSVHDDNANRFKRVNYDRNLRNIRAKGEINPPGMDEDNNKAIQTLDAWAVITLEFIRGYENSSSLDAAHAEWQRALEERIQKKQEFDEKHGLSANNRRNSRTDAHDISKPNHKQYLSSCSSSSAPTSPTSDKTNVGVTPHSSSSGSGGGILHTSSQFLSNLWHGATTTPSTPYDLHHSSSTSDDHYIAAMQKSKSSSNVGQFVSRKILKNRSKSQTRQSAQPSTTHPHMLSKWSPSDKFTWTSDIGNRIYIEDTNVLNLSDIEAKILHHVAIDKINELNIGISLTDERNNKSQKRRVLPKKKAMTTSFFDIGKKDASSGNANLFGNSLEACVVNDKTRTFNLKAASIERGCRNSMSSIFRINGSNTANKLNENVRSYESLPSTSMGNNNSNINNFSFGKLTKSSSAHISRSQSDIRRKSQDLDVGFDLRSPPSAYLPNDFSNNLQVPNFVSLCIKYLEQNGLHKIGLFRVSTSKKRVKQMREGFDKNTVSGIESGTCPHDVATLLKEFLRDLPEPLLCSHLYKAFLKTQRIRNRRLQLEAIGHLVKLLPPAHRDTLYVLLKFLAKVAASSDDVASADGSVQVSGNKMDSNNLATVFAPNILHGDQDSSSGAVSEQESMNDAINVIRIMIDHYEELFRVPAELVDAVYSHMLDVCPEKLYILCEQRKSLVKEDQLNKRVQADQTVQPTEIQTLPVQPVKRLYTRKSVMHDNDASTIINNIQPSVSKRHLDKSSQLVNTVAISKTQNLQNKDESRYRDSINRRQSSPNVLDSSGVVSASLQIPMHLNHANVSDQSELDEVFYKNVGPSSPFLKPDKFEYSDIPYIEDGSFAHDMEVINECFPISGSLSFSTKFNAQSSSKDRPKLQSVNDSHNETKNKIVRDSAFTTVGNQTFYAGVGVIGGDEPKLPTSITNIGGDILRSKTADFEKMCTKSSQNPAPQQQHLELLPKPSQQYSLKTSEIKSKAIPPQFKVYKRQELIQSAKRIYENKK